MAEVRSRHRIGFLQLTFAVCILAGAAVVISPFAALALMIVVGVVTVAAVAPAAIPLLVMANVACAYFLLNRLDELLAVHIGPYTLKVSYWFTAFVVSVLALQLLFRQRRNQPSSNVISYSPGMFALGWAAFVVLGLLSVIANSIGVGYVPDRSATGEILALGSLCLPMAFAALLPASNFSKRQVLAGINLIMLLAAATALVAVVFAVAPAGIYGILGWSRELALSGGLLRASTPLGHPNTVAAVLALSLPVAIVLGVRHPVARMRYFNVAGALLIFGGILFSQSRTAVAVAVPMAIVSLLYALGTRTSSRTKTLLGGVLLGGLMLAGTLWLITHFDFSRFRSRYYYEDANVERRVQSMTTGLQVFYDHPVLGASPNSVYPRDELQPDWIPPALDELGVILYYRGRISAANPHNLFLTILAEYGLLGGLVMLLLLGLIPLALWRTFKALPPAETFDRSLTAALGLSFVTFLGMGLGGALFTYSVRIGTVFWIFTGLGLRFCVLVAQRERGDAIADE